MRNHEGGGRGKMLDFFEQTADASSGGSSEDLTIEPKEPKTFDEIIKQAKRLASKGASKVESGDYGEPLLSLNRRQRDFKERCGDLGEIARAANEKREAREKRRERQK